MRKAQKRGLIYEKYQARKRGAKHVGGPGREDARRGRKKIEIKHWKEKIHKGAIKKAVRKGIKTVVSKSGFTAPAKEYAKLKRVKLISRGRKVK